MKKYFDTLSADALKSSHYSTTKIGEKIDELVSNAADIIDAGREERIDMSAHAMNSIEKTMAQVSRCMAGAEETKLFESLQKDVVGEIAPLLLGETCCIIIVALYLGYSLVWSR